MDQNSIEGLCQSYWNQSKNFFSLMESFEQNNHLTEFDSKRLVGVYCKLNEILEKIRLENEQDPHKDELALSITFTMRDIFSYARENLPEVYGVLDADSGDRSAKRD